MKDAADKTAEASLLFTVGEERCRLPLRRLRAVAPWASLRPADDPEMLGWLDFRGEPVPVIDLNQTVYGEPTRPEMGSRILLLECDRPGGGRRLVGALAAEVFAMAREDDAAELFDPCDLMTSLLRRLD